MREYEADEGYCKIYDEPAFPGRWSTKRVGQLIYMRLVKKGLGTQYWVVERKSVNAWRMALIKGVSETHGWTDPSNWRHELQAGLEVAYHPKFFVTDKPSRFQKVKRKVV